MQPDRAATLLLHKHGRRNCTTLLDVGLWGVFALVRPRKLSLLQDTGVGRARSGSGERGTTFPPKAQHPQNQAPQRPYNPQTHAPKMHATKKTSMPGDFYVGCRTDFLHWGRPRRSYMGGLIRLTLRLFSGESPIARNSGRPPAPILQRTLRAPPPDTTQI